MSVTVHPTAIVSSKAHLDPGVTVGPYSIVEDDVVIGESTSVGPHVVVANGARIGKKCVIHSGAVVSTPPQDLKYNNEPTQLEIGDNTTVREFCTLNRGTIAHGKSVIGSDCLLMAYTHVAHDCIIGNKVILANVVQLAGHVTIQDWAIIGGGTMIHQFTTIGSHTMVGGGFRVTKDIPPYIMAGGHPVSFERLNIIGLRRRGFSQDAVDALREAYRILYTSKLNVSQAVETIKERGSITTEVQNLLDFIAVSQRGIIPGYRSHGE